MAPRPTLHPVYHSMNTPLTIWGAERRLFLLALVMGVALFNFFGSLLGGAGLFAALYAGAPWMTATDHHWLRIVPRVSRRARLDPGIPYVGTTRVTFTGTPTMYSIWMRSPGSRVWPTTASGPTRAMCVWPSASSTSVKKMSHDTWP